MSPADHMEGDGAGLRRSDRGRRRRAGPRGGLRLAAAAGIAAVAAAWAPVAGAGTTVTPVRIVGGPGHAGLYGWGAATLNDGSVLIGDYWNFRIAHYAANGDKLAYLLDGSRQGMDPGMHQSPYGIAVDPVTGDVYFGDVDGRKTVDKYDPAGNYLLSWGSEGTGRGKFKYPSHVAVASDRRVYVADQWDHNIVVHDPAGNELFQFGSQGTGPGQFRQPRGIAFDANDRLFVADSYNTRVQVFDKNGGFLYAFGSAGTKAGQFGPAGDLRGLAVDKVNGWVYVVDAATAFVNKFDLAGNYLLRFGGYGNVPGKFSGGGRGVTVDGGGNVWVGDMPGFRAQKFSPSGAILQIVPNPAEPPPPGGFNAPTGVAVDSAGNILVADQHNQRIQKLAPDGSFIRQWGTRGGGSYKFNYPRTVAVDRRDDSVVVADTDNHMVKKYTKDGVFQWQLGGFGTTLGKFKNLHSLAVAADGTIYVADTQNQRVVAVSASGAALHAFGVKASTDGNFQFPRGITVDPDGTLWVSDSIRGVVQHFTTSGTFLGKFGSFGTADNQLERAAGVAADSRFVYVSDVDANRIKVWTKDGSFQQSFGAGGSQLGRLFNPHGLSLTLEGRLYVAEQNNERIQEFQVTAAPAAVADTATATAPDSVAVAVLSNDSDPDGDVLSVRSWTTPAHGTVSCTTAGTCTYTPIAGFTGTDGFTYTADDGRGGTAVATVTVTVR